jgi:hypothetical protein
MARFSFRNRRGQLGEHVLPLTLAGALVWLVTALLVRIYPDPFAGGWLTFGMFVVSLPLAELIMLAIGGLLGLQRPQRLAAVVVLAAVVLLLTSVSMATIPWLYGAETTAARTAAAWIIWSAALLLLSAWYASRP